MCVRRGGRGQGRRGERLSVQQARRIRRERSDKIDRPDKLCRDRAPSRERAHTPTHAPPSFMRHSFRHLFLIITAAHSVEFGIATERSRTLHTFFSDMTSQTPSEARTTKASFSGLSAMRRIVGVEITPDDGVASSKMLGGASQTVSTIRVQCSGK